MTLSDLDILLTILCITSYVTIRFILDSGWIFGSLALVLICAIVKRTSEIRQTLYLYLILLSTSKEEQEWLQKKFDFSLNSSKSKINENNMTLNSFTDLINKTLTELWPFVASFIEEKVRNKIEMVGTSVKDSRMKSLIRYFVDFKAENICLGTCPLVVEAMQCHFSENMKNLLYVVDFKYIGNGSLTFSTYLKKISVETIKLKGRLCIELGPLIPTPPFCQEVKIYMPAVPELNFAVSDTPEKITCIAHMISLERISKLLVLPSYIDVALKKNQQHLIPYMPQGVMLFHLVEARHLPNKESFGQSDPYCVIRFGQQRATTKTVRNNLHPVWNFITQMICLSDPLSGGLDVSFGIYDEDLSHEVFHDFLLRTKMCVRRILEEGFVDEWLYDSNNADSDSSRASPKGRIRVQALWQNLSDDKNIAVKQYAKGESGDSAENESSKNISNSNPNEINSSKSDETLLSDDVEGFQLQNKKTDIKNSLFKSILIVWIDFARNLEPSWEDFAIEIEVYEEVERTSFVSKDKRKCWSWRRRFVFPVLGLDRDIHMKILSRSCGECCADLVLPVSSLMNAPGLLLNLKDCPLSSKNHRDMKAVLNLALALRALEPLSEESLNSIYEAQNEAKNASIRRCRPRNTFLISSVDDISEVSEEMNASTPMLSAKELVVHNDLGSDVLPNFLVPDPYFKAVEDCKDENVMKRRSKTKVKKERDPDTKKNGANKNTWKIFK